MDFEVKRYLTPDIGMKEHQNKIPAALSNAPEKQAPSLSPKPDGV